jgi:hypothetical protein
MTTSDPTRQETTGERAALLAARNAAARHVYDAECALHDALQAARGASIGAEAGQCDRWVAAAYAHLHAANLEYTAAADAIERARSGADGAANDGAANDGPARAAA